jgi:hypothetical protein
MQRKKKKRWVEAKKIKKERHEWVEPFFLKSRTCCHFFFVCRLELFIVSALALFSPFYVRGSTLCCHKPIAYCSTFPRADSPGLSLPSCSICYTPPLSAVDVEGRNLLAGCKRIQLRTFLAVFCFFFPWVTFSTGELSQNSSRCWKRLPPRTASLILLPQNILALEVQSIHRFSFNSCA